MWACYFCGPTDEFLHAMFIDYANAMEWCRGKGSYNYKIIFWEDPSEIDTSDTGWIPTNNSYTVRS